MKDKSTVEFGKELESYLAEKFKELGFPNAKRSKGSGNQGQLGDITGQDILVVEAKNRNTEDITLKQDVWDKLKSEIPLHSKRLPMYVLRNKNQKTWCVMDAEDMFTILKGWLENLNGRV
jgi:Holliday junction resolvase